MSAPSWESIDVHLLKILHTLLAECSVSRAARKLGLSQPAVSTALRRLRDITGDQLLVRSRNGMTPTERGSALLDHVRNALTEIELIARQQFRFEPQESRRPLHIATPDYLHAVFVGKILGRLRDAAPHTVVTVHSLGPEFDYQRKLEDGEVDLVIGNWPHPPEHLRIANLFEDEVVCMMRKAHPLAGRKLSEADYLNAEHLAPTPYSVGQRGVIDITLSKERLKRNVVAYVPYFNLAPYALVESDMIFTAPRRFARHYASILPLATAPVPLDLPKVNYYLLWHDRTHYAEDCRWFREQIIAIAREQV